MSIRVTILLAALLSSDAMTEEMSRAPSGAPRINNVQARCLNPVAFSALLRNIAIDDPSSIDFSSGEEVFNGVVDEVLSSLVNLDQLFLQAMNPNGSDIGDTRATIGDVISQGNALFASMPPPVHTRVKACLTHCVAMTLINSNHTRNLGAFLGDPARAVCDGQGNCVDVAKLGVWLGTQWGLNVSLNGRNPSETNPEGHAWIKVYIPEARRFEHLDDTIGMCRFQVPKSQPIVSTLLRSTVENFQDITSGDLSNYVGSGLGLSSPPPVTGACPCQAYCVRTTVTGIPTNSGGRWVSFSVPAGDALSCNNYWQYQRDYTCDANSSSLVKCNLAEDACKRNQGVGEYLSFHAAGSDKKMSCQMAGAVPVGQGEPVPPPPPFLGGNPVDPMLPIQSLPGNTQTQQAD